MTPELRSITMDFSMKLVRIRLRDILMSSRVANNLLSDNSFLFLRSVLDGKSFLNDDDSLLNISSVGEFKNVVSERNSYFGSFFEN